jgi:hypothetical protein
LRQRGPCGKNRPPSGRPFGPIPLKYRACCRSSVVEHSIGNGEVDSSILSGSTIPFLARNPLFAAQTRAFGPPARPRPHRPAISAGTNGEILCQPTQNRHDSSGFVSARFDPVFARPAVSPARSGAARQGLARRSGFELPITPETTIRSRDGTHQWMWLPPFTSNVAPVI